MHRIALFLIVLSAFAACASVGIDTREALKAQKIEVAINAKGQVTEIEYHILPSQVPAVVRAAMDELHPGSEFTGAEKEWEKGTLYYELTRGVDGMKVEAMFRPDGKLHSEEIQVKAEQVPDVVKATAASAMPNASIRQWEIINDSNRELVEYHAKLTSGGMAYKLMISPKGTLLDTFREIPAEIEIQK